jgi:hypothetical protein
VRPATSFLVGLCVLLPGCSLRDRPITGQRDGAAALPEARTVRPSPDVAARLPGPEAQPPVLRDKGPGSVTCPAPCASGSDCVAVYPDRTVGQCLKRCASGCGPCGGGPGWSACSQCQVEIAGTKYCMDFCWWKYEALACPDPNAQGCVDAYGIPGNLLGPGYPGSKVCVPK